MTRVIRPLTRRFCLILILLLFLLAFSAFPAVALEPQSEIGRSPYAPGEIVIGWQPDSGEVPRGAPPKGFQTNRASADWQAAAQTLEARTGLTVLDADPYYGRARLSVPPGQEQAEIARLSALPWIEYAEPNYIAHAADTYPSDPYFGRQWNMRRVYAPAAWDLGMGTDSIIVSVVDSGIDLNHPEFAGRILEGYDYVRGDSQPNDEFDHGTHVSGIIAAEANNGVGVVGLAANVQILPLKVLDNTGSGWYYDIGSAIQRAADESAQIINLSLQGTYDSLDMRAAVLYATQHGCLVVAAAGNCAQGGLNCNNTSNPTIYPAAYPDVLAVAATDIDDNRAIYSGYKPYVGLAAPGGISSGQIWSTVRESQGGYSYMYGTSMATPMVSAAAALVWTYLPTATAAQITNLLKQSADKVGSYPYVGGRNDYFGYGRLNIGKAVRIAYPPSLSPIPGATQKFLLGGSVQQSSGQVSLVNPSEQPVAWQASVLQGADWLTLSASSGSGAATFSAPGSLSFEVDSTGLSLGQYPGLIRVLYDDSQHSLEIPVQLQVAATLHYGFIPQASNAYLPTNWFDPLPGGQALDLTDNSVIQVPLPFLVSLYGQTYSSIWVSDNGIALFSVPAKAGTFDPANCIPSAARPNDAFYVLWHDWVPELGGGVYAHQPNSDTFVITWNQVARPGITAPHSFQLVLTRAGGVLFQYQAVDSPLEGTIGIENFDGTLAQQVLCNGAGRQVRSGDALLMNPVVPW
jgi:subtilisin family serine protease